MRKGRGNIEIPAIVSGCVCARDGERKNGYLTAKEETQTDMGNNKCGRQFTFFLSTKGGKICISKRSFSAACCINGVMEYMGVNLYIICWPKVN